MKKKTALLLTGICTLALLAGCGSNNAESSDNANTGEYTAGEYVTLGEYNGMEVSVEKAEVTEDDVKAYVEQMLAYYPSYTTLEKTVVEDGDAVNIDYEGLQDGVAFDGGTATNYVLVIGSGSFIEGFESGLIGANVGDTVNLNLTFPESYGNTELAGKAVVFNVTVNAIVQEEEVTYDTMTDEYVLENFQEESVQAFKDMISEGLTSQNDYDVQSNVRSAILDKLMEICTVNELPEGELDKRVTEYKEEFALMCTEQYGIEMSEYLETYAQTTEEDFNTQVVEYMQENLELELILQAIADAEGIELDEEGYQEYVTNMMANYQFETEEEFYEQYGEDYVKDSYVFNKVIDMLVENASVTYTAPEVTETETATESSETETETETETPETEEETTEE